MFAPTSTSKRTPIETNLTNFCFSRTVITSCIHPMRYRARPNWERRWTDWKWQRNPDTALYLCEGHARELLLVRWGLRDSRMKRRQHRQGSKPASPPTLTVPSEVEE